MPSSSCIGPLWVTVSCDADRPLASDTHGVDSRLEEYLHPRGCLLLVANDLKQPASAPRTRTDIAGNLPFTTQQGYIRGFAPQGALAAINQAQSSDRIFLDDGSVPIAISSSQPFTWDPASGIHVGSLRKGDAEFRIIIDDVETWTVSERTVVAGGSR